MFCLLKLHQFGKLYFCHFKMCTLLFMAHCTLYIAHFLMHTLKTLLTIPCTLYTVYFTLLHIENWTISTVHQMLYALHTHTIHAPLYKRWLLVSACPYVWHLLLAGLHQIQNNRIRGLQKAYDKIPVSRCCLMYCAVLNPPIWLRPHNAEHTIF